MPQITNASSVSSQTPTDDLRADQPDTPNTKDSVSSAVRTASYFWLHFVNLRTRNSNKFCVIKPAGSQYGK